jgi:hypothetical protein
MTRWAAAAALAALITLPALADLDLSLGVAGSVKLDDDTELFLSVSARHYDRDPAEVRQVWVRYRDPDDVSVALFLAHHSGRSLAEVLALRARRMSWWEIGVHLQVRPEVYFLQVDRTPRPPYGRAYGYWKKHRHTPGTVLRLTDVEVRDLVAARVLHDAYGMPAEEALRRRADGGDVRVLVVERERGPGRRSAPSAAHPSKGRAHPHGKSRKR